jgi:hypothetical protein
MKGGFKRIVFEFLSIVVTVAQTYNALIGYLQTARPLLKAKE